MNDFLGSIVGPGYSYYVCPPDHYVYFISPPGDGNSYRILANLAQPQPYPYYRLLWSKRGGLFLPPPPLELNTCFRGQPINSWSKHGIGLMQHMKKKKKNEELSQRCRKTLFWSSGICFCYFLLLLDQPDSFLKPQP